MSGARRFAMNEIVRVIDEPEDGINSHARISKVCMGGYCISNMNMPFQGTYANTFVRSEDLREVKKP